MRKITPITIAASTFLIVGLSYTAFTNSGGKGGPTSGSPASNNQTCAQCHSGAAITSQTIDITTDIPSNGFIENTDYNITITSKTNGGLGTKMGFNSTIESNGFIGTVSAQNNETQVINNAVTHKSNSNTPNNGEKSWTYTWNSGSAQTATIYAAGVFANGNGTNSGDAVATTTLLVQKSTMDISEYAVTHLKLYPNPASTTMHVDGTLASSGSVVLHIYNLAGELVLQKNVEPSGKQLSSIVDVSQLTAGTYSLVVNAGQRVTSSKFIKL